MRLSLLILLSLFACGGGGPTTATPLALQTFNPSLGVDLTASTTTVSGAWYRDLVPGTGNVVANGAMLNVDYTGWLPDGTMFGSSQNAGMTFTFVLGSGEVIQGWDEGLIGAKAGGTRQLIIPASLAYADQKRGNIPAYSNLVFQIIIHSATGAVPVEQTTFAASLNVDLAKSIKTANGVYVRDTTAGSGAAATTGQKLTVDYTGWLPDGTKFDASQDHNNTFSFSLGKREVIAGWDEGLAGVQAGATRQLVIPTQLAYGVNGQGSVPPYANLVFSVVVHSIK